LEGKLLTKEQSFFNILECFFVGTQVKGQSGYIKLMQIRSHYYKKHIIPSLKNEINQLVHFPEYREEIFEKLYTFFSHYLSPTGSICFCDTPQNHGFYDKAYNRGNNIFPHWATHMLYYVKTDRPFADLEVELNGFRFYFDVSNLNDKKSNDKQKIIYQFREKKGDSTLMIAVITSERRKRNKIKEILRQFHTEGVQVDEETIRMAISLFESQGERDYFINKDAHSFLKEQFGLWICQNLYDRGIVWNEEQVKKMQALQKISLQTISLISQFEEELLHIWNKPKFILKANYVITLDRIAQKDSDILRRLASHPSSHIQIDEWRELGLVNEDFQITDIFEEGSESSPEESLSGSYCHLPIDTKYFKDLQTEILSLFDNLDQELDGWLIKSENYQALNTILPKFQNGVQTIYIDPPFNREQDPGYSYSVKYKDAHWTTLLENRLQLAQQILSESGCIFVRCDYNGNMYVRLLMDEIFGPENFKNEVIIKRSGIQKQAKNKLLVATDSLFFYSKTEAGKPRDIYEHRETNWLTFVHYPGVRKSNKNRLVFGYILEPPPGRHWGLKQELIDKWISKGWVRFRCRGCGYEHYEGEWKGCPQCGSCEFIPELKNPPKKIDSNWTNIQSYSQDPAFPTRNAEDLLKRVYEAASAEGDLVMDFFLGSGTATAAAQKMKRKWIGVEMGDHFYTYVLPRMKRVLAGEQTGISKEVNWQGGGFFKYCELEQYEDTLSKVECDTFLADQVMTPRVTPQIQANQSIPYEDVDIPGSLSCLTGKWIRKITPGEVEFQDGSKLNTDNFDRELIKPFIRW
jgi:adenine-specific DNA-methyltransferase